jgi:hypothetical protein
MMSPDARGITGFYCISFIAKRPRGQSIVFTQRVRRESSITYPPTLESIVINNEICSLGDASPSHELSVVGLEV